VGKRILVLLGVVVAAMLLIAGVAAAAGGPTPSKDVSLSTSSSYAPHTDTTAEATDTTGITTAATPAAEDTTTTELSDDASTESSVHPDNFGGTISSLRHAGDHTPAAILHGHKVPGWQKNHPGSATTPGSTTTTAPPA
jgi:hypothetical protein